MTATPLGRNTPALPPVRKSLLSHRGQRLVVRTIGWVILGIVLLIALFPVYFMSITAFHPPTLSFSEKPVVFTTSFTLKAFRELTTKYPFATWMRNTFIISFFSTIFSVVISVFAAYSLSRLHYPGRRWLSNGVFLVYLFPATLIFIPVYILLSDLKMLNNFVGLIAVYLTFTIPFCIWLLKAYFLSIPMELEDAAMVDGATRFQSMYRVVLPLAAPGIATAAIYSFTLSWNEYLYAFTLLSDSDKFTLAPGLTKLIFGDVFLWGMIMAGGFLMSIPVLLLYFGAQRFIVAGLAAGAVKG
jgi:multiple sugar transport system permease protein